MTSKEEIGRVTHYYDKAGVAVVELSGVLRKGDQISVEGVATNFFQRAESIQIERQPIEEARPGDAIGLKVVEKTRKGDLVYKINP